MPSTRRRQRNRRNTHQSEGQPTEKKRDDGICYQGKWYCNCEPRREASHYQVQKDGPNKDRWFYKCTAEGSCKFFLWESDAKLRPETALEPEEAEEQLIIPKPKTSTQRQLTSWLQVTPSRGPEEEGDGEDLQAMDTPCPPTSKRKRDAFEAEDGGDDLYGMASDEEKELIALADQTLSAKGKGKGKAKQPEPTTSNRGPYITPASQRTVDVIDGLPTPSVTRTLFPASSAKRQKTVSFEERQEQQTPSSCTTATVPAPTPSSASQPTTPGTPGSSIPDVTEEVMPLLQGQKIDPGALKSVRQALVSSARKTRGVVAARDYLRGDSREKATTISRLQERVEGLTNKNKLSSRQVTNIKAGLMKLHEDIASHQVTDIKDIQAGLMKLYKEN